MQSFKSLLAALSLVMLSSAAAVDSAVKDQLSVENRQLGSGACVYDSDCSAGFLCHHASQVRINGYSPF